MFIGTKMMLIDIFKIPVGGSLLGTLAILGTSMLLSLLLPPRGATGTAYPFKARKERAEADKPRQQP